MDLVKEAGQLALLSTFFVWLGWIGVGWALLSGLFWWIDLGATDAFGFLESFAIAAGIIGTPLFLALVLASFGHAPPLSPSTRPLKPTSRRSQAPTS